MNTKPTSDLCASFGHNYVRANDKEDMEDVVRCKHCNLEVEMSSNGDFDNSTQNSDIYEVMKQLFLLRRRHRRVMKGFAMNY